MWSSRPSMSHLPVEVRQGVLVRPLLDLMGVTVWPSVGIRAVSIAFLEPLLVFTLQLVVEPHALDLQATRREPRCLALVGAIDLGIMFQLALAFEPGVERLAGISVAGPIRLQQVPASVRQDHRLFAVPRDAHGLDEALF